MDRNTESNSTTSIERRILFAGKSRFFFDRSASHAPFAQFISYLRNYGWRVRPQRIPDKLVTLAYDVWESLRIGRIVPSFGNSQAAAMLSTKRLRQPPNYRTYWHDTRGRIEIGMHVGVDFIRHEERYYPLELQLDAALHPARRNLYPEPNDPIVSGIVGAAAQAGYDNLIVFHRSWNSQIREEFGRAAAAAGLRLRMASLTYQQPTAESFPAMPEVLPQSTLCVIFPSQHGPIDYVVGDKSASSAWLQDASPAQGSKKLLGTVVSSTELFVPPLAAGERWPNLVIKLGGMDSGSSVVFAKVRDESEALQALGMRNRQERPQVFSRSFVRSLKNRLFGKDQIVYQQFIPPELTDKGYARIIRGHFLFTPLRDMFLSAHFVISDLELASAWPFGRIRDAHGLIVNRHVGAHYERTDTRTEHELRAVAFELGQVLREEISWRFEVTPDGVPGAAPVSTGQ